MISKWTEGHLDFIVTTEMGGKKNMSHQNVLALGLVFKLDRPPKARNA